jgi:hypothetical protein
LRASTCARRPESAPTPPSRTERRRGPRRSAPGLGRAPSLFHGAGASYDCRFARNSGAFWGAEAGGPPSFSNCPPKDQIGKPRAPKPERAGQARRSPVQANHRNSASIVSGAGSPCYFDVPPQTAGSLGNSLFSLKHSLLTAVTPIRSPRSVPLKTRSSQATLWSNLSFCAGLDQKAQNSLFYRVNREFCRSEASNSSQTHA